MFNFTLHLFAIFLWFDVIVLMFKMFKPMTWQTWPLLGSANRQAMTNAKAPWNLALLFFHVFGSEDPELSVQMWDMIDMFLSPLMLTNNHQTSTPISISKVECVSDGLRTSSLHSCSRIESGSNNGVTSKHNCHTKGLQNNGGGFCSFLCFLGGSSYIWIQEIPGV